MSLGPFVSPKRGLYRGKTKKVFFSARVMIGILYPAKKVFSIQIPVFSIQTTVYYIYLTTTVSDLPIQPQKVVFISKIFLAFTAPGFWLLLFGRFGF
jgi:hypothetical protein